MEKGWRGLPYHTIAEHYQRFFGEKVYKIPVTVVDNCPNRMGLKGMETCVFCDEWGSAADAKSFTLPLKEQIESYQLRIGEKFKSKLFLVYFQAYTNTFTKISALRANFDTALSYSFVKGFTLGTRPDCLSPAVLDLWQEYHQKSFVFVELGIQSFFEEDLLFFKRGHSVKDSFQAIEKIAQKTSVDLGIHLIFGAPGETPEKIKETAKICNSLPITNVKLHNLHVLKNTPLEILYKNGSFNPISFEKYSRSVEIFLEHLNPCIAIQRLAAYAPRWEELIAPDWTKDKMKTHQGLIDHLRKNRNHQGRLYTPLKPEDVFWKQKLKERAEPLL